MQITATKGTAVPRLDPLVLDRQQTAMLKGIAIIIMLAHHLILSGKNGGFYSAMPEWLCDVGRNFKFCVCLFSFVTGYGLCCKSFANKWEILRSSWRQLLRFLPMYVTYVVMICCLYKLIDGRVPYQSGNVVVQCLLLGTKLENYWYAVVFMIQVLVFFPLLAFARFIGNIAYRVVLSCLVALVPAYLYILSGISDASITLANGDVAFFGFIAYCLEFAMYFFVGWLYRDWTLNSKCTSRVFTLCALFLFCLSAGYCRTLAFLAPCLMSLVFVCCNSLYSTRIVNILSVSGRYSAHMWLNHALIYSYWMKDAFFSIPPGVNFIVLCIGSFSLALLADKLGKLIKAALCHIIPAAGVQRGRRGEG